MFSKNKLWTALTRKQQPHIPFYNTVIVLAENWIVFYENCFNTTLTTYSSEFSKKSMRFHELRVRDNSLSLEAITSESLYKYDL